LIGALYRKPPIFDHIPGQRREPGIGGQPHDRPVELAQAAGRDEASQDG
jgi:hypothetical protein